jgi:adenine phosphoribosyltransferase
VQQDAFEPGERVLIVDDVLATGGTVAATVRLITRAGAFVTGVSVLMELGFLSGRERLPQLPVHAVLTV